MFNTMSRVYNWRLSSLISRVEAELAIPYSAFYCKRKRKKEIYRGLNISPSLSVGLMEIIHLRPIIYAMSHGTRNGLEIKGHIYTKELQLHDSLFSHLLQ